jgi:uncharacterized protein YlzI (FlbEa/FlbD family)
MTHLNIYLRITYDDNTYFLNPVLIESIRQINNTHSEIKMNSGVIHIVQMTPTEIGNHLAKLTAE